MFLGDKVFCKGCNERIYEGELRMLDDGGVYHQFCHRKKRRDELLRALLRVKAQGMGIRVMPHRNPP